MFRINWLQFFYPAPVSPGQNAAHKLRLIYILPFTGGKYIDICSITKTKWQVFGCKLDASCPMIRSMVDPGWSDVSKSCYWSTTCCTHLRFRLSLYNIATNKLDINSTTGENVSSPWRETHLHTITERSKRKGSKWPLTELSTTYPECS